MNVMTPDREHLEQCARDTGFGVAMLEKIVRLGELAADVFRHPLLQRVLVLKGGTVLNLCLGSPQRLSVDLDFNHIGHASRERMLAERPEVEQATHRLARARAAFASLHVM